MRRSQGPNLKRAARSNMYGRYGVLREMKDANGSSLSRGRGRGRRRRYLKPYDGCSV